MLGYLDRHDADTDNYLDTWPGSAASPVMAEWLQRLDQGIWLYQQTWPLCGWLEQRGLPRARERVETTLGHLARMRNIRIGAYNDKVRLENMYAGLRQNAVQFNMQMMAASSHQTAVTQTWVQHGFDIDEKRCYGCHKIIGVTGGGYCYDCARSRGWVY